MLHSEIGKQKGGPVLSVFATVTLFTPALLASDCLRVKMRPGNNPRAYQHLQVPENCDVNTMFTCPGGILILRDSKPLNGKKIVGGRCYTPGAPELAGVGSGRRILSPEGQNGSVNRSISGGATPEISDRAQTPLSAAKEKEIRKKIIDQGVPAVILDRAMANHKDMLAKGKTTRPCFLAADMTRSQQGVLWKICLQPEVSVTTMPTFYGSGMGPSCSQHPYRNNYSDCARFFGNKKNYCLTAGGNYVTGNVTQDPGSQRPFVELTGLDKDENDNAGERHVGIHQTTFHSGRNFVGQTDPSLYSNGCFTIPGSGTTLDPVELSQAQQGGGMALYVYPAKQDILKFRNTGKAPYWDPTCAESIGTPGWLGTKDHAVPSPEDFANEQLADILGNVPASKAEAGLQ